MSMKPKEALLKDGFITEVKRGRMSLDMIERCKTLATMGWDIEGFSVSNSTGPTPVVNRVVVSNDKIVSDLVPETHNEHENEAYVFVDGKRKHVGMRTVCNICRCSLTHNQCEEPKVWIDHKTESPVYFKRRTTPLERLY